MTRVRFLSGSAIEEIHRASIEILERTGILVKNQAALELLKNRGCEVIQQVAKISGDLIEESLKRAPPSFRLHSRDGRARQLVGEDNVIYNPGSAAIYFIDGDSHEMRRATARDLVRLVRLVDALEHIKAQSSAIVPGDVPDAISDLYRLYVILRNSNKPMITGAFTKEGLLDMKSMLEAVVGGPGELTRAPRAIFDCCPSSPLMWSDTTGQNLIDCSENGIPAEIVPAPQMGATSPVTVSGTLIQSNAEILSGVVISQAVRPGAPIIYGGSPSAFDMRHCTARLGAIEAMIAACSAAEIGRHYKIPTHAYLGLSDSKVVDSQSGFESTLGIALAALCSVNIVSGPGMLASENCQSLEKLVIDNEICGDAYRLIEGISMEPEAMATDVIAKVGPGGHFLAEKHTRQWLRNEQLMPSDVVCRLTPEAWKKGGSKSVLERSKEEADRILSSHVPHPLTIEGKEGLDRVFGEILARHGINPSKLPSIE